MRLLHRSWLLRLISKVPVQTSRPFCFLIVLACMTSGGEKRSSSFADRDSIVGTRKPNGKRDTICDAGIEYGTMEALWILRGRLQWRYRGCFLKRRSELVVRVSPRPSALGYSWLPRPGLMLACGNSKARFASRARWRS